LPIRALEFHRRRLSCADIDSSANASFKGTYYFRHIALSGLNPTTGAIGQARSVLGTMILDGAGGYNASGTLLDSVTGTTPSNFTASGGYQVSSNGLMKIQNELNATTTIDDGMGLGAFRGKQH
jgi:hypothetical protein